MAQPAARANAHSGAAISAARCPLNVAFSVHEHGSSRSARGSPVTFSKEKMKRVKINVRRLSFGSLFLLSLVCAFSAAFLVLLVALPVAKIDPQFTPASFLGGLLGILTIWPLAVALWFSISGWIVLALIGRFRRLPVTFVCDDDAELQSLKDEAPNQPPEPTRSKGGSS